MLCVGTRMVYQAQRDGRVRVSREWIVPTFNEELNVRELGSPTFSAIPLTPTKVPRLV